ncbi:MAG: DUF222 domain-containing protein, partial [Actinomycetota bacterium]
MFESEWKFDEGPPERPPRDLLPAGLGEMAPGVELARALDGLERRQLNGHELVVVLKARARQIAHLQAELYADMWELASTPAGDELSPAERTEHPDEFVADEVAAALRLTPHSADREVGLAYRLSVLAEVREALRAGRIDLGRARVLCEETSHLEPAEAREVACSLLEEAPELTARQLGGRLRRRCQEQNPDAARKRYEDGVDERRVEDHSNPDGTGDLWGRQLPADRVVAIRNRINDLARSLQAEGDERTLDQLRADIFMDLLQGNALSGSGRSGAVEMRVDLLTLLELDDRSAELAGWGPIVADLARQVARSQQDGQWRFTVTDPETGLPLHTGVTRRRPTAGQQRQIQARNPTCTFPGCPTPAHRCH